MWKLDTPYFTVTSFHISIDFQPKFLTLLITTYDNIYKIIYDHQITFFTAIVKHINWFIAHINKWFEVNIIKINLNYLQTTSNFHDVSIKSPFTTGFSARHVIDLPSSSVVGTKLNSLLVVLFKMSSYTKKKENKQKIKLVEQIECVCVCVCHRLTTERG